MPIMTYRYQVVNHRRNNHLHAMIESAGDIWNTAVYLQRKSDKLMTRNALTKELRKMRRSSHKDWGIVLSHSIPYISDRLDKAYKRMFSGLSKRPRYKREGRAKSVVIAKQNWDLRNHKRHNFKKVRIGRKEYEFHYSRPLPDGHSGALTVKRTPDGKLWLIFVVEVSLDEFESKELTGKNCAFDFGLKTYLTLDNGETIDNPQYLKLHLAKKRRLSRSLSRKVRGSNNWCRAKKNLAKLDSRITNLRSDWQWKLAHKLCDEYDTIFIEDLELRGMGRLWGRKVGDLAHGEFTRKLEWIAAKSGKRVMKIDRFYPSSKLCSSCGNKQEMALWDRTFHCSSCGTAICRDWNAAINIKQAGERLLQESRKTGLVPQAC